MLEPDQSNDNRWMTYAEAGKLLGLSKEAIRALARRHGWPRQSPNGIGLPVRVLVPADRLAMVAANGHDRGQPPLPIGHDQRRPPLANGQSLVADGYDQGRSDATSGHDQGQPLAAVGHDRWESAATIGQNFERPASPSGRDHLPSVAPKGRADATNGHDRGSDQGDVDVLRVMGKALEIFTRDLTAANERADRADRRADALQDTLIRREDEYRRLTDRWMAELTEQRHVIKQLTDELAEQRRE